MGEDDELAHDGGDCAFGVLSVAGQPVMEALRSGLKRVATRAAI